MVLSGLLSGAAGGATVAIVIKAVDQFSGTIKSVETSMDKLKIAGNVAGVAIAGIATGLGAFGVSAVRAAAESETMERQFRKLTDNSDAFLASLNKATHETVSDFELMSAANKALALGLTQNELPEFFEKAAILGQITGRTVTEAVEDITLGVGRQSKLILDNLGIIVNAEDAYTRYAEKLGVTADKLDDSQKKAAFLDATLKGMTNTINENSLVFEEGMSQKLEKIKKQFDDMKVAIGEGMLEPLKQMADQVNANTEAWNAFGTVVGTILKETVVQIGNVIKGVQTWIDYLRLGEDVYRAITSADIQGVKEASGKMELYRSGATYKEAQQYGGSMTSEAFLQTKQEWEQIQDEMAAKEEERIRTENEWKAVMEELDKKQQETTTNMEGLTVAATVASEALKMTTSSLLELSSSGGYTAGESFALTGAAAKTKHTSMMAAAVRRAQPQFGGSYAELGVDAEGNRIRSNQVATGVEESKYGAGTTIRMEFYNQANPQVVAQDLANKIATTGAA